MCDLPHITILTIMSGFQYIHNYLQLTIETLKLYENGPTNNGRKSENHFNFISKDFTSLGIRAWHEVDIYDCSLCEYTTQIESNFITHTKTEHFESQEKSDNIIDTKEKPGNEPIIIDKFYDLEKDDGQTKKRMTTL